MMRNIIFLGEWTFGLGHTTFYETWPVLLMWHKLVYTIALTLDHILSENLSVFYVDCRIKFSFNYSHCTKMGWTIINELTRFWPHLSFKSILISIFMLLYFVLECYYNSMDYIEIVTGFFMPQNDKHFYSGNFVTCNDICWYVNSYKFQQAFHDKVLTLNNFSSYCKFVSWSFE